MQEKRYIRFASTGHTPDYQKEMKPTSKKGAAASDVVVLKTTNIKTTKKPTPKFKRRDGTSSRPLLKTALTNRVKIRCARFAIAFATGQIRCTGLEEERYYDSKDVHKLVKSNTGDGCATLWSPQGDILTEDMTDETTDTLRDAYVDQNEFLIGYAVGFDVGPVDETVHVTKGTSHEVLKDRRLLKILEMEAEEEEKKTADENPNQLDAGDDNFPGGPGCMSRREFHEYMLDRNLF